MATGTNKFPFTHFKTDVKRLGVKSPGPLCEQVEAVQKRWKHNNNEDKLLEIEAGIGDTRIRLESFFLMFRIGEDWSLEDQIAVVEYLCEPEIQGILIGVCGYTGNDSAFLWKCAIFRLFEAHSYSEATKAFEEFFKPLHPVFEKIKQAVQI